MMDGAFDEGWRTGSGMKPLMRDADRLIQVLKTYLRLIVESCRYTIMFKQHLENTPPQDGQSGSSHGSWALGDLCRSA